MVFMSLALTFNPLYNAIILQVIWAIGISMVILSLVSRLPVKIIFGISLAILLGHNAFDGIAGSQTDFWGILWRFMHGTTTFLPLGKTRVLFIAYSFLPWTGIMLLGYCTGYLFNSQVSSARRAQILFRAGLAITAFFILLRYVNIYGDPVPWSVQKTATLTFLSFLNLNKYPPSLLYAAMTLGPSMIFLSLFEHAANGVTKFFTVYGKVPFFYYIIHFYLIHFSVMIVFFLSGYGVNDIVPPKLPFFFRPQTFGYSLDIVYLIWITLVLLLYPLCKKFGRYKATHLQWWLSYL